MGATQRRDIGGNIKVKLDEVRARDSYSIAATDFSGVAGLQIFANASGLPIYIDRLFLQENSAAAGVISIYDGTVAAGTLIAQFSFTSSGSLNLSGLGVKKATSTSGIFAIVTNSTSTDLLVSVYSDPEVEE